MALISKMMVKSKVPSGGQPTSNVGHSEEEKVCHGPFLISTDKLCALALTSAQWLKVRLRGVITVCPIVKVTNKTKQRLKTLRQILTDVHLHLDSQNHSNNTEGYEGR